jgi:hypothetical protein
VLATIGGRYGGWALLVQDSKPVLPTHIPTNRSTNAAPINRLRRAIMSSASSSNTKAEASAKPGPQPCW